jgi:hypothetical protein
MNAPLFFKSNKCTGSLSFHLEKVIIEVSYLRPQEMQTDHTHTWQSPGFRSVSLFIYHRAVLATGQPQLPAVDTACSLQPLSGAAMQLRAAPKGHPL